MAADDLRGELAEAHERKRWAIDQADKQFRARRDAEAELERLRGDQTPMRNALAAVIVDLAEQRQRAEQAEAAIERVRAAHPKVDDGYGPECRGCGNPVSGIESWPCPTIRALDAPSAPESPASGRTDGKDNKQLRAKLAEAERDALKAELDNERAAKKIAADAADRFRDVLSEALGHPDENPGDDVLVAELRQHFGKTGPEPTRWRDFLTGAQAIVDQINAKRRIALDAPESSKDVHQEGTDVGR